MSRGPSQRIRAELHAAAGGRCEYCGKELPLARATLDHVQPRSKGGGNGKANLAVVCKRCDVLKADRTPNELLAWATRVVEAQQGRQAARRAEVE
jgi:5-methylcytosine-specific restriction endonuclease McrA